MKRVYEAYEKSDGFRVLVDRLWPRGESKEKAHIDLWAKDITPSTELREEFHSGQISWNDFKKLYSAELTDNPALNSFVEEIKKHDIVTLLFAGKDTEHTHVKVIMKIIEKQL